MNSKSQPFDYSVVIRTLGTSGEKYEALLHSIEAQSVKPKEVIVVMAHGYSLSPYHSKYERVVWTRKGMVNQRQVGFEKSKSPLLLVVDDDVAFDEDFVERMYDRMVKTKADCIFPVAESPIGGGKSRAKILRSLVLGSKRFSHSKNPYYLRIGATGGTIVNTSMTEEDLHWCQTANFQCFFIKRETALDVHLEDEMWLEDTGYAWPDDQVFFYKVYLRGCKTLLTQDIHYQHLDAKSGNVKVDKTYKDHYLHQRNITIFWYRFLWAHAVGWQRKMQLLMGLSYKIGITTLFYCVKCVVREKLGILLNGLDGYRDAMKFIKKNKIKI